MLGLTSLGVVHTAISLVALGAGFYALVRDREISPTTKLGKVYVWTTILTCLTSFGIFQHGGFGKPHALGIITLLVLAFASWRGGEARLGHRWRYVVALCFTLTLFFHFVPGVTETLTRFPLGAPVFANPDDPVLAKVIGAILAMFVVIMVLQVRRMGRVR